MDKAALLDALDTWPAEERLDFLHAAWDRYGTDDPDPGPEAWAEIDRRRAEHTADPRSALTREEFEAQMRAAR